jgi:arylsulfatase
VRDPLVVHWPTGIPASLRGTIRRQFCHAIDLTPTILDVTGAPGPGPDKLPMHGASIVSTFSEPEAPAPRHIHYFEQMGHRGLWADGWKVTTYHQAGQPFEDDEWGLYHLDTDFSECVDLAAAEPERLREMIDAWWVEAGRYGVLPLDDRSIELFVGVARPGTVHARSDYVYYPPIDHIPADASPPLGGRNWTVTADVDVPGPDVQGVLYARGGHNVGHSFFLLNGRLQFDYNALGTHHRLSAPVNLAPGRHELAICFDRDGKGGTLTLSADGAELASLVIPRLVRMLGSTGLDVGRDGLSPVVDDYLAPFPFTGTIDRIAFRIRSRADAEEVAAVARTEMAKE